MANINPSEASGLWLDVGKVLFGAIAGVFGGYWLRILESQKAEILRRADDACAEIDSLRGVCGKYWSRDTTSADEKSLTVEQEGEILGRVHSLSHTLTSLYSFFATEHVLDIKAEFREFRQSATSGAFASDDGHVGSAAIVNGCHQTGANLVRTIRSASRLYNKRWFRLKRR